MSYEPMIWAAVSHEAPAAAAAAAGALATGMAMLVTMVRTPPPLVLVTVPVNCPSATSTPSWIANLLIENVPANGPTFWATPVIGTSSRLVLGLLMPCATAGAAGIAMNDPIAAVSTASRKSRFDMI